MSTITDTPRPRRPGLVGPVVLIGLGGVLLMNNLGLLGWGVWAALAQLWPLLLVALGLELMLRRRMPVAGLVIPLAFVALAGLALWWSGAWRGGIGLEAVAIQQPLAGAERADVTLAVGVGELRLAAMQEPEGLIAGTVRATPGMQPAASASVRDGVAVYRLEQRGGATAWSWSARGPDARWDLRLSREVPLRLTLDTGAGTTVADLSGLQIAALEVNSGVGTIDLTLPQAGALNGTVNGGIGQTTVTIPRGVAARLTIHHGLGDVRAPGGYIHRGEVYESPDYARAAQRVDLVINGGLGEIAIREGQ